MSSTCRVSFDDGAGMTHTVSVSASSLWEAAVLGLCGIQKIRLRVRYRGPGHQVKVAVEAPTTMHELSVGKLQAWFDSSGKTPRKQASK